MLRVLALASGVSALTSRCDDLTWANQSQHQPVGEGNKHFTAQTGYSWHVHYLHYTQDEEGAVLAFQQDFCKAFAKYGENGTVQPSPWGPNCIAPEGKYIVGDCDPETLNTRSNGRQCGNGTCTDNDHGPWSLCQNEFYVPAVHIDEVSAWIDARNSTIPVMRHPNSGCQWGDHSPDDRALFFGPARVPEMCLWQLPCNDPGFGCYQGMCGQVDGIHHHQHASECVLEVKSD